MIYEKSLREATDLDSDIILSFEESLFIKDTMELASEIAEISIDSCLDDGLLKDIPFVGIAIKVYGIAQKVHDRHLIKQTLTFLTELNSQTVSVEKKEAYRQSLKDNHSKANEELGRVLLLLNRSIEANKAKILSHYFAAYINCKISWPTFIELSEVLDRMFVADFKLLDTIFKNVDLNYSEGGYSAERLMAMGLFSNPLSEAKAGDVIKAPGQCKLILSKLGRIFCQHW